MISLFLLASLSFGSGEPTRSSFVPFHRYIEDSEVIYVGIVKEETSAYRTNRFGFPLVKVEVLETLMGTTSPTERIMEGFASGPDFEMGDTLMIFGGPEQINADGVGYRLSVGDSLFIKRSILLEEITIETGVQRTEASAVAHIQGRNHAPIDGDMFSSSSPPSCIKPNAEFRYAPAERAPPDFPIAIQYWSPLRTPILEMGVGRYCDWDRFITELKTIIPDGNRLRHGKQKPPL